MTLDKFVEIVNLLGRFHGSSEATRFDNDFGSASRINFQSSGLTNAQSCNCSVLKEKRGN